MSKNINGGSSGVKGRPKSHAGGQLQSSRAAGFVLQSEDSQEDTLQLNNNLLFA